MKIKYKTVHSQAEAIRLLDRGWKLIDASTNGKRFLFEKK